MNLILILSSNRTKVRKKLAQIRKKEYYQAFWNKEKPVIGIGVNFLSKTRNIQEWKEETF
ncbi:PD-(D/E)XK nuclease domain-containing protein [Haliscomenobacter sp.]|uniref:PD-(D/E)XK nuclease domain-containing protein n=1 Tax=Haliscomenobacter sp. TaxID=2717303 RepID=UPI0033650241